MVTPPGVTFVTDGHQTKSGGATAGTGADEARGRRGGPDVPENPRLALVQALATAVARGAAVGDLELARVAHEALGSLLGLATAGVTAPVPGLAAFRQPEPEPGQTVPHERLRWASSCSIAAPITVSDVAQATVSAVQSLDEGFFRVPFDRLTPRERDFLRAMAELGPGFSRSGDIAAALGTKSAPAAPPRSGLIKKGMSSWTSGTLRSKT